MPKVLPFTVTLFTLLIVAICPAAAQKYAGDAGNSYYPAVRFIVNASETLPRLHKEGRLTDMQNLAVNWLQSPSPCGELVFALQSLIAVENHKVDARQLPVDFLQLLDEYAAELQKAGNNGDGFKYYIKLPQPGHMYDASGNIFKYLQFTRAWAGSLLQTRLTDSTAAFLCRVFAGSIARPSAFFAENRYNYAALSSWLNCQDSVREKAFVVRRNSHAGTMHLLAGIWLPNKNLGLLGPHPSIGLQMGVRDKLNEYDLTASFRFLGPTPHPFNVLRQDSLYNSTHYDGGYLGFDYTRYFIHRLRFEAGVITGIGYDYFDPFRYRDTQDGGPDLSPYSIGSFDFNAGLHLKWFIHRRTSLGIQARYHFVNYGNRGGTDFGGNAVTIDFSYGAN